MSRKTKKVVGVLLSLTLLFAMSVNVFAAGSSSANGAIKSATATNKNGKAMEIKIGAPKQSIDINGVKSILGSAFVEGMEVYDVMEVTAINATTADFPITVTFQVPTVVSTTKVAVLHYGAGGWENVAATPGKGIISATFTSLSPVAIVVDKNTAVSTSPSKTGTSPKTGEFGTTSAVAVLAILAIGGAVVCYRKREEVR